MGMIFKDIQTMNLHACRLVDNTINMKVMILAVVFKGVNRNKHAYLVKSHNFNKTNMTLLLLC